MANDIDLVNLGIYLFVGLAMVANGLVVTFLYLGALALETLTLVLILLSTTELVATLGLWMYSGHIAARSRPALAMLGEVARRAELVLALSTPLFDLLEELTYRFQWSPEARREILEEKIEELRDKLDRVIPPEPEPPPDKSGFWKVLVRIFTERWSDTTRRKEPASNPESKEERIVLNRWRGRRME